MKKVPRRLYKYRPFNARTLALLVADQVFSSDPSTFNDPLDTRPSLDIDLEPRELARILRQFVEQRLTAELKVAATTINYRGPKTMEHIARISQRKAHEVVAELIQASNPEYDEQEALSAYLGGAIKEELLRRYDKGIVSFAERATCPLMWSHYGDQHYGICFGYSVPDRTTDSVHKVNYRGGRLVKASMVADMLTGCADARRRVDEVVLLRKAKNWRYEREWRLIGDRGLKRSPLELEEVIFGLRCKSTVKFTVMKTLEDRPGQVKFFEIREVPGEFKFKKHILSEHDEMFSRFPDRALRIDELFSSVTSSVEQEG